MINCMKFALVLEDQDLILQVCFSFERTRNLRRYHQLVSLRAVPGSMEDFASRSEVPTTDPELCEVVIVRSEIWKR